MIPIVERFWSKVEKLTSCWMWRAAIARDGYGKFQIGRSKTCRAHRVAWELTNGPIPNGKQVLHRCDNPLCVRPDHLFLGTAADNMRDKTEKGRQSRNHQVISAEDQAQILRLRREGYTQQSIAAVFGISQASVSYWCRKEKVL